MTRTLESTDELDLGEVEEADERGILWLQDIAPHRLESRQNDRTTERICPIGARNRSTQKSLVQFLSVVSLARRGTS